jgi:hypothetical protein
MARNLTLVQRNRLVHRAAHARKMQAADYLLVDGEGRTVEPCDEFFAAVLRRASLNAEGKGVRLFIVYSDVIYRVLFPRGDYAGWQFRKCEAIGGA